MDCTSVSDESELHFCMRESVLHFGLRESWLHISWVRVGYSSVSCYFNSYATLTQTMDFQFLCQFYTRTKLLSSYIFGITSIKTFTNIGRMDNEPHKKLLQYLTQNRIPDRIIEDPFRYALSNFKSKSHTYTVLQGVLHKVYIFLCCHYFFFLICGYT